MVDILLYSPYSSAYNLQNIVTKFKLEDLTLVQKNNNSDKDVYKLSYLQHFSVFSSYCSQLEVICLMLSQAATLADKAR